MTDEGDRMGGAVPGMGTGVSANNPVVVAAFHAALRHQALVVLALGVVVVVAGTLLRAVGARRAVPGDSVVAGEASSAEPAGRRLLRLAFGALWLLDGVLQGQSAMPLGMIPQVVQPAAATSPAWVRHLAEAGGTLWNFHPVTAASAAVWIQVGIGLALIVAPRGTWSRLAGVASLGWGVLVWVFGEAFGGIFAPGASWLFGTPGAVVFYCVAGALVALPEGAWAGPRLGRLTLRGLGVFFLGMAVLQAWPGRGSWVGRGPRAQISGMTASMAPTPQPHLFSTWVSDFTGFATAHGFAINLFVVAALAVIGAGLLAARRGPTTVAAAAAAVLCLADWVLVQDFGFFGGVGTDPNSMIPMALLIAAGYVAAMSSAPAAANVVARPGPAPADPSWGRLLARPAYAFRAAATAGALGVVLVGAAPMAVATTNPHADPILTQALDGTVQPMNQAVPAFRLVDQRGRVVTQASLRGKVVALTFLDPVCTSDCPLIAQELREAGQMLGSRDRHVELVAIDANPRYTAPMYLAAFTDQEHLGRVANWQYLTGPLPELRRLWRAFGVAVVAEGGGAMIGHTDIAYVIDPSGHARYVLDADPGQGTNATMSSFAATLSGTIAKVLTPS